MRHASFGRCCKRYFWWGRKWLLGVLWQWKTRSTFLCELAHMLTSVYNQFASALSGILVPWTMFLWSIFLSGSVETTRLMSLHLSFKSDANVRVSPSSPNTSWRISFLTSLFSFWTVPLVILRLSLKPVIVRLKWYWYPQMPLHSSSLWIRVPLVSSRGTAFFTCIEWPTSLMIWRKRFKIQMTPVMEILLLLMLRNASSNFGSPSVSWTVSPWWLQLRKQTV